MQATSRAFLEYLRNKELLTCKDRMENVTKLDLNEPVQTKNGKPVRIVCTDFKNGTTPVLGIMYDAIEDREQIYMYSSDGRFYANTEGSPYDLVNVPKPVVSYHNVYDTGMSPGYRSHDKAEEYSNALCRATIKITYTRGKGATAEVVKEY